MISSSTKKKLDLLDNIAKPVFEDLLNRCYDLNLNVQISSSFRSFTEQDKIYQQGRTLPGKIVSNAKAGTSLHNYRRACDLFILDGKKAIFEEKYYKQIWDICLLYELDKRGMFWGGSFASFKDTPHFEVSFGKSWKEIASECGIKISDIQQNNWKIYKNYL